MKKKAIIFDIDGTAMPIGEGNWPSERLKNVISKLKDSYHISTGTGRSSQYALDIIDYLGLQDECIIAAGSELYDPINKKITWAEIIPKTAYKHITNVLRNNNDRIFSAQNRMEGFFGRDVEKLLDGKATVLYLIAIEEEKASEIEKNLTYKDLTIINMHSFWGQHLRDLHIHSVNASKEHAVSVLLDRINVDKKDTIVIGDGLNDTHLFKAGGLKVAMGNAVIELKYKADLVIGDVADDGLAKYFESLVPFN